jgi:hypothetical protein
VADARELSRRRRNRCCRRISWTQPQGAVRAVPVIVADVADEHSAEVPLVQDEKTVYALRSHGAYPAFGDGVRFGCPNGAAHNARTLALPHRVEARTELVVAITEQVLDSDAYVTKLGGHVAGHLGNPVPGGVGRDAGEEDPERPVMDERGRRAGAVRSCRPRRSRRPRCPPPAGGGTGARWQRCASALA